MSFVLDCKNRNFFLYVDGWNGILLYLCRRYSVPKGSIGNRVRIPYSSRCCMLFKLAIMPLKTNTFREGGPEKRSKSEDLPYVMKRCFRDKSRRSLYK